MKNYEKTLPEGYEEVYRIDATDKKIGLIMNAIAVAVATAFIIGGILSAKPFTIEPLSVSIALVSLSAILLLYMVLHELVHGAVYKAMTGEKLSFGLKWSCAYCGVPNVYVYRKTAFYALIAPLIVFTIVFAGLSVAFWFVDSLCYIAAMAMTGFHLGGCSGDIYTALLLSFKFKDGETLMRDTGPEQTFYIKKTEPELVIGD